MSIGYSARFYPAHTNASAVTQSSVPPPVPYYKSPLFSSRGLSSKAIIGINKTLSQRIKAGLNHTPTAEKVLFWSGFMYVPAAIITPVVTDRQLKAQQTPNYERRLLVQGEIMRQIISASLHFIGFFGGMALPGLFGKKQSANTAKKTATTVKKLIGSVVGTTLMSAFARPLVLNAYMANWVKQNQPQPIVSAHYNQPRLSPPLPFSSVLTGGTPSNTAQPTPNNKVTAPWANVERQAARWA